MKLTIVLAVVVAALGGALLATIIRDDGTSPVVQQEPASQFAQAPAPTATATPAPEQTAQTDDAGSGGTSGRAYVEPEDRPISRHELARVRDAATQAVGGGRVTDIDRSDDYGVAYEVEIVRSGQEVDVRLDRRLSLVATDYDD